MKTRFLEPDEISRLLDQPKLDTLTGLRNRCIMQTQIESGLRIGEVVSLGVRDIVIADKRIEVLHGKGDKQRTCYYRSSELSLLIEKWKKVRPTSPYLFCAVRTANKGKMLDPNGYRYTFANYVKEAGLPEWARKTHILRHTFATNLTRAGTPLPIVAHSLGHSSVATSTRYIHCTQEDVKRAVQRTDNGLEATVLQALG